MKEELINATLTAVEKGLKDFSFEKEDLNFLLSRVNKLQTMIEAKINEVQND